MAEVTLTLKGVAALRLQQLLKDAVYPNAEAAVADALEENRAPDLDAWLHNVVGPRLDAMRESPAALLTPDQVRAQLFGQT